VSEAWWISLMKAFVVVNLLMLVFTYMTLTERKVIGRMQLRYGPNRAGPYGLLQPFADLIKLIRKESFFPVTAIDRLYILAPGIAAFTALASFAVIPWGPGWTIHGYYVAGAVVDVPISLILVFALGSIGIYGFIVGGWASDSKFALLGSMRTCAQLVSYEVSLALSVLGGTSARRSSASWSSCSPAPPRRAGRRSTSRRPSRSSSPATTPSTGACATASTRWPSTST
jgi:NADH-quinone oxidoreductase subunit H